MKKQNYHIFDRALVSDIVVIVIAVSDSIDSGIQYIYKDSIDIGDIAIHGVAIVGYRILFSQNFGYFRLKLVEKFETPKTVHVYI